MEYKFEIKAQTIGDLESKIDNFVRDYIKSHTEIGPVESDGDFYEVPPSMEHVPFPDAPPQAIAPIEEPIVSVDPLVGKQMAEQLLTKEQFDPLINQHEVIAAMERMQKHVQTDGAPEKLDSEGFPWDERIHSAGESKNKDGTWRVKRGVNPELIKQIQAEFKGVPYVPDPISTPAPVPVFAHVPKEKVQDPVTKEHNYLPLTAPIPIAAVPAAPLVAVPTPPNTVAYNYQSFKDNFFQAMTQLINLGKITQPYVQQLTEYYQLKQIWDITKNEVQCQNLFNNFVDTGLIYEVKNG